MSSRHILQTQAGKGAERGSSRPGSREWGWGPLWGGGGAPAFAGRGPHSSPAWARPSPTGTDAASPSQGLTAYHDISLDKCYVIELNTTIVLPPRNFWELLMNVKVSGVGGILSLPGRPALWRPGPGQSRALWRKAGPRDVVVPGIPDWLSSIPFSYPDASASFSGEEPQAGSLSFPAAPVRGAGRGGGLALRVGDTRPPPPPQAGFVAALGTAGGLSCGSSGFGAR